MGGYVCCAELCCAGLGWAVPCCAVPCCAMLYSEVKLGQLLVHCRCVNAQTPAYVYFADSDPADTTADISVQVAPAFRDAPGVAQEGARKQRLKPQLSAEWPAFHPPKQGPASAVLPEVTMVFCGPAQYKVSHCEMSVCVKDKVDDFQ